MEYGEGSYTISVEWPYESGNDEQDTFWGEAAYDFNEENPNTASLSLTIILIAQQIE